MARSRVLGLVGALAGLALAAAPAAAASSGTPVTLSYNALTFVMANQAASQTASNSACHKTAGATFGPSHGVNGTGIPFGTTLQPTGSPVAFQVPPAPPANDAVCLADGQSTTIAVTSGNYGVAYFIEAAANGPAAGSVTPTYSSGAGAPIPVVFDDWCTLATKGTLTPGTAAVLNGGALAGGPRLASKTGTMTDSSPINCGYWVLTVPLNASQTLTGLQVSVAASGATIPTQTGVKSGTTQAGNAVVNIAALSLGSGAAASSAALPKTGGSPLVPLSGGVLLLGGLALFVVPKIRRGRSAA